MLPPLPKLHSWAKNEGMQTPLLAPAHTNAHAILWNRLCAQPFKGMEFTRNVHIGMHLVLFCSRRQRLVIDIADPAKLEFSVRDHKRDLALKRQGFRILRFSDHQILVVLPFVLGRIGHAVNIFSEEEALV